MAQGAQRDEGGRPPFLEVGWRSHPSEVLRCDVIERCRFRCSSLIAETVGEKVSDKRVHAGMGCTDVFHRERRIKGDLCMGRYETRASIRRNAVRWAAAWVVSRFRDAETSTRPPLTPD